ncbi:hypothetical protein ZIOFF_047736 [Zingiber officinale]|uniref:Uncharacterized protein n=1 Tax=Zingiber officinale TaxID=94328 RepID=A0A8J5FXW5_ZINOF|nr:hypothetical protein ZIOFF_047736 [Zingiber officinale]
MLSSLDFRYHANRSIELDPYREIPRRYCKSREGQVSTWHAVLAPMATVSAAAPASTFAGTALPRRSAVIVSPFASTGLQGENSAVLDARGEGNRGRGGGGDGSSVDDDDEPGAGSGGRANVHGRDRVELGDQQQLAGVDFAGSVWPHLGSVFRLHLHAR